MYDFLFESRIKVKTNGKDIYSKIRMFYIWIIRQYYLSLLQYLGMKMTL